MAIEFKPFNNSIKLEGQEVYEKMVLDLLKCTIDGLHRVEKQLEKITDEEIDDDERTI